VKTPLEMLEGVPSLDKLLEARPKKATRKVNKVEGAVDNDDRKPPEYFERLIRHFETIANNLKEQKKLMRFARFT